MWNRRRLRPPPECSMKVDLSGNDIDKLVAIQKKLKNARPVIREHLSSLTAEHYVLSRMVYKLVNQLRRDKAIAGMRQVNTCLKRLFEMKIKNMLKLLDETLNVDSTKINAEEYLPSMQSLQYQLVRLVGIAALLTKTAHYCTNTFIYLKKYLDHGNFFQHYLVLMALSARIWYVSRSLRIQICHCYKALNSCLNIFPAAQASWLPETETLPKNLTTWLKTEFGVEEKADVVRDMKAEAEKQTSLRDDTRNNETDEMDLGVPVQRRPLEDSNNNVGKQRGNHNEFIDTTSQSQKDRIQTLKILLKSHIKSRTDVENFQGRLTKKFLKIGEEKIAISKLGKKKITKKIMIVEQSISEEESEEMRDRLFVKKLRPCLARLIVKYDKEADSGNVEVGKTEKCQQISQKVENSNSIDTGRKKNKRKKCKKDMTQTYIDTDAKGKKFKKIKSQMVTKHKETNSNNSFKKKNKRKKKK